jgi:Tfp pilus assembly protein PilO
MLKDLTYKKKLRVLAIGFAGMLFIVYSFALKKTLEVKADCEAKQEKLTLSKNLNEEVVSLKKQLAEMDNVIGEMPDTSKKVMDNLLENITAYCSENNCTLKEIPGTHKAKDANFEIESNLITVQGSFHDLLGLVYLLEQKKKTGGRVSSVQYYSKKDYASKKISLYLTLTVQHYKKYSDVKENT